jgi:hypothetical protein
MSESAFNTSAENDSSKTLEMWVEVARNIATIEAAFASKGAVVVFKIDGQRFQTNRYTIVVSWPGQAENAFHRDGPDMGALVRDAIAFLDSELQESHR